MKGVCVVRLWRSRARLNIAVLLYDQSCKKCNEWAGGAYPYEDEIGSIIGRKIDKWLNPGTSPAGRVRRTGNPKRNHDSNRCEACAKGMCQFQSE